MLALPAEVLFHDHLKVKAHPDMRAASHLDGAVGVYMQGLPSRADVRVPLSYPGQILIAIWIRIRTQTCFQKTKRYRKIEICVVGLK
jgi:hypothetical protein